MYNPNGFWDLNSGKSIDFERELASQISNLCSWDINNADVVMTFGGKACLMYAMKLGMNRVDANNNICGIDSKNSVVVTSEKNHYIIENASSVIGLGSANIVRVPLNKDETMDIVQLEEKLIELSKVGKKVASIILSGGDTIDMIIDDVEGIYRVVEKLYNNKILKVKPLIHVDAVVSWAWLTFKNYDFNSNVLQLSQESIKEIECIYTLLEKVKYADSIGIDFHKTDFTHYQASMFITKDSAELRNAFTPNNVNNGKRDYGCNFSQYHTIEHSRSMSGVLASWYNLQRIGLDGFRLYLSNMMDLKIETRKIFEKNGFRLLNKTSKSFSCIFQVRPLNYE